MNLPATVRKHGKKISGSNRQGNLVIEGKLGTVSAKLEITHLNNPELFEIQSGETVNVEIHITRTGVAGAISQPHIKPKQYGQV